MAKDINRSAAGLRRSAIAERLRIREEWSALKEIERNTLNESPNQNNPSKKQQPATNFVIRYPTTASKNRNVFKTLHAPRCQQRLSISEVLRGLVVHVDVGSVSKALALRAALSALGATVSPVWTNLVTHLVWSDGGCRDIRSRARALACKLVSPLWVEACAAAGRRLPEGVFPAASRPSDLPSPNTLKRMLKKVEQENKPLNLLVDSQDDERNKAPRLRISSDTETNTSQKKTENKSKSTLQNRNEPDIQARINTAPRRAFPVSTSPERPTKSKRRLFTQKEDETQKDDETDEDRTPDRPKTLQHRKMTHKKNQLNRALVRKFVGTTKTNSQNIKATQGSDKQPRIVLTGMSRQERQEIIKAIKHLNGRIQSTVNKKTTHVLLGTCGPFRADNVNYCNKCDSIEKILSQMFETNLAVNNKKRKENVVCKCISSLNKNGGNGQDNDLNTSLLDQGRDSQDICNSIETIAKIHKPRTLNALLGAVRGCRILYAKWAVDSFKINRWVHHFGYEVKHLKKISEKARFERSALQKLHSEYTYNVFNGTKIKISQDAEQKDALTQLLSACGAQIQNGGQENAADTDVRIGRETGQICSKWVFDSVAAGRLRTTRRYINKIRTNEVVVLNQ